ncbi:protein of unknown function [Bartonella clarridgeiae 73]|uniref:Uncharacterized protein n=1 Tax=Bartonella clarridgeiae (strain CCUG 45776 / CIP 104772 / 73) TaxID=696125 RepID=E6YJG5_BARC7|nr:protein of unknown function [Bartonella clarridgeiae 73]
MEFALMIRKEMHKNLYCINGSRIKGLSALLLETNASCEDFIIIEDGKSIISLRPQLIITTLQKRTIIKFFIMVIIHFFPLYRYLVCIVFALKNKIT